jgi:hypothetical protein
MRIAALAAVMLGLGFFTGLPGGSDTTTHQIGEAVGRLIVVTRGHVDVMAGDTVEVAVTRNRGWLPHPEASVEVASGELEIDGRCRYPLFFDAGCTTDVQVTVPAETEVEVRTSSGKVTVAGVTAGVDLTTTAGGIEVDNVSGPARLVTSAGGISGDLGGGDIDATTSAGSIILDVTAPFQHLSAVTSAGSIELSVPDEVYDVDFSTAAGNVDLDVRTDPESERTIVTRTSAGGIRIGRIGGSS